MPDLQIVICLRHPLEVAQSLERRNMLSVPFGLQLWHAYQTRLLANVRPGKWLITHYESHLADPRAEILRITEFLDFAVAAADLEQAAGVCKKDLHNNRVGQQSCLGIPRATTKLYYWMCEQAGPVLNRVLRNGSYSRAGGASWPSLPAQSQALLAQPGHFALGEGGSSSVEHLLGDRLDAIPSPWSTEIDRLRDDLKARDEEIERLHGDLVRVTDLNGLRDNLQSNAESLQRLSAEVVAGQTQVRNLSGEITSQNAEVCRLMHEIGGRESEIRRLSCKLERSEQRLLQVAKEAEARTQEAVSLRGDVASLSAETRQLSQKLHSQCEEAARTADDLAACNCQISALREEAADRNRTIENLRWQTWRWEQQLKDIYQSRAWKVIGELRRIKSWARKFAQTARLAAALPYRLATLQFLRRNGPLAAPRFTLCDPAAKATLEKSQTAVNSADGLAGGGQAGRNNPLFDAVWYQQQYPDVAGWDPFVHYLSHGAVEGRRPHPLFDSRWYLQEYQEVAREGLNPLLHFLSHGTDSRYWPNPLFDSGWYMRNNPDVAASGMNPLLHFIAKGSAEGRKPNPYFDPKWYLEQHPELAAAHVNLLTHYMCVGEAAGFPPSPLFDPAWYAEQHAKAEVGDYGPLAHYLHVGLARKAVPNAAAAEVFDGCIPATPLPFKREESPLVSIIVPVHNQWLFTLWSLRSIWANSADVSYEVILADDASSDETLGAEQLAQNITVLRNDPAADGPVGFLKNCNRAAAVARGKYIFFLNNDTLVGARCLRALVEVAERDPQVGLVGCKLLFADGRLQEAGGIVWQDASAWNYGRNDNPDLAEYNYLRETDYCSGAAILVRRDLWEKIGGFDEQFAPAYYEDTDLAFAIRQQGYRVVYQPQAVVVHFEGASHGIDLAQGLKQHQVVNRERFLKKWRAVLQQNHYLPGEQPFLARDRSRSGQHVLLIDWEFPAPDCDSGSFRICNLMRILKSLGYRITFVPANMNPIPSRMEALQQEEVFTACGPGIASIEQFLANFGHYYQLVIVSRVNTASVCMDAVRRHCPDAFVIFDTVDLHFLREQRQAELQNSFSLRLNASETKRKEVGFINMADLTLVVSPVEAELLKLEAPHAEVVIVSNIHPLHGDVRPFQSRRDMLFIGGFRHTPNVDAVKWLVNEIFPELRVRLPDAQLLIIGSDCPPDLQQVLAGNDVKVLGYVPDVEPYFQRCRLSVVPLRYGAGVKGKVNMSMSYGVPVVSTAIGVEGMFLRDGVDVMVADTPKAFVEAVCQVYENQALWEKLSQGGQENVRRHFSFEVAEATLRGILQRIPPRQLTAAA
jgi:GT2 family glycosyltransferase/glycosyltransferase involved in cell wall biosynthesis